MVTRSKINEPVTLVGYIDPVKQTNNEAGIILTTNNAETFIVELNKEGRRLMNLIDEKVQVTGTVTKTKGGKKQISVTTFNVIEYKETFEDDEEYEEV